MFMKEKPDIEKDQDHLLKVFEGVCDHLEIIYIKGLRIFLKKGYEICCYFLTITYLGFF